MAVKAQRDSNGRFVKGRVAQQNVGDVFQQPNREPTPELKPNTVLGVSGQAGVYDEIMAGHPKAQQHLGKLRAALGSASYSWQAVPKETLEEAAFREDLDSIIAGAYLDSYNKLQGWSRIAQSFLQHWTHGSYVSEIRAVEESSTPRNFAALNNVQLELYQIHPSTIQQYIQSDNYRVLEAIRQQVTTGSAVIKAENLVIVQRGGVVGQYVGESILRALVFPFLRWKNIWLANEQTSYMQGGLLVFEAPEEVPGGVEDWKRVQRSASRWATGDARFILKPFGWKHEMHAATGSVNGDEIDRIDAYFDFVLGDPVSALISSSTGHRALGEVAVAQGESDEQDELAAFLRDVGQRIGSYVAELAGFSGRVPTLSITPRQVTTAKAETVAPVMAAITAGLVDITHELKVWVAQQLGIPAPPEPQVEVEVVSELQPPLMLTAEAAPVEESDGLFHPPEEAQSNAAEALLVRRQMTAEAQGLQMPTDLRIARKIAAGAGLSQYEVSLLRAWFKRAGDPTLQPDFETEGPSWQDWNGRGGNAMSDALLGMSVDVDGVSTDLDDDTDDQIEQTEILDGVQED